VVRNDKGEIILDPSTAQDGISKLDSQKLIHISKATDGRYFEIGGEGQTLNGLKEELSRIKKREYATKQREKREEKFAVFAATGLSLLLVIPFIPLRRKEEQA